MSPHFMAYCPTGLMLYEVFTLHTVVDVHQCINYRVGHSCKIYNHTNVELTVKITYKSGIPALSGYILFTLPPDAHMLFGISCNTADCIQIIDNAAMQASEPILMHHIHPLSYIVQYSSKPSCKLAISMHYYNYQHQLHIRSYADATRPSSTRWDSLRIRLKLKSCTIKFSSSEWSCLLRMDDIEGQCTVNYVLNPNEDYLTPTKQLGLYQVNSFLLSLGTAFMGIGPRPMSSPVLEISSVHLRLPLAVLTRHTEVYSSDQTVIYSLHIKHAVIQPSKHLTLTVSHSRIIHLSSAQAQLIQLLKQRRDSHYLRQFPTPVCLLTWDILFVLPVDVVLVLKDDITQCSLSRDEASLKESCALLQMADLIVSHRDLLLGPHPVAVKIPGQCCAANSAENPPSAALAACLRRVAVRVGLRALLRTRPRGGLLGLAAGIAGVCLGLVALLDPLAGGRGGLAPPARRLLSSAAGLAASLAATLRALQSVRLWGHSTSYARLWMHMLY